jgi:hypothetical protein
MIGPSSAAILVWKKKCRKANLFMSRWYSVCEPQSVKLGDVLGPGVLCFEAPIARWAIEEVVDGISMLIERLLDLKRLGADSTFRFVNSRIDMLPQSLRTATRLFALPTRYGVRRGSKVLL